MRRRASRMYKQAARFKFPSFFVGCRFKCVYCGPSFQRQMKRMRCIKCYNYEPHPHWERFRKAPPRTREDEFLFMCDFSDVAFAPKEFFFALMGYCLNYLDRTFLLQSKAPR